MATVLSLKREASRFYELDSIEDFSFLIKSATSGLVLMALHPQYHIYKIRKKQGGFRLIEDPHISLKKVLQKTNRFLQAVYFAQRPSAVYGFCLSTDDEEERNIVNNAKKHLDQTYMLNIDLQDFFHSISYQKVYHIFEILFPNHHPKLTRLLTDLCCYNMRLPMGSPTSPVLSNFACLELDAELHNFCISSGITFTRFADDLCFSGNSPIGKTEISFIRNSIRHYNFIINENKVKYFEQKDVKTVTGLIVGEKEISLPDSYLSQLKIEIERYREVMIAESRFQTGMSVKKLHLFKQELQGKWNFVNMVMPDKEEVYRLKDLMDSAFEPLESFESENWLDLPYTTF